MVYNLGMGLDPQRNASSVVMGADGYAQQLANLQAPQTPSALLGGIISQEAQHKAKFYDNYAGYDGFADSPNLHSADFWQQYLGANAPGIAQGGGLAQSGWFAPGDVQQYQDASAAYPGQQAAYTAQAAALAKQQQAATQNQATQQQAYNQQTGGGFNGGILNSSYSQPFGNVIQGMPAPNNGFAAGMMGGGGSAAPPGTGLTPFGAGGSSTGQQAASPQGWGGPFSAKNPWSLG